MAGSKTAFDAPAGRDCCKRVENEVALFETIVRDDEPARSELAATPQNDVEVEHAGSPMLAAPPSELALDVFDPAQHLGRIQRAFDQRDGIGELAAGPADGGVEDDWRGIEQAELSVEPGDGGFDYARRAPVTAVRAVGADGDGIELGHPIGPVIASAAKQSSGADVDCFVSAFLAMTGP